MNSDIKSPSVYEYRITGVDPANPGFGYRFGGLPLFTHLSSSDAKSVDCYHTDGGCYGYGGRMGHADIYVNNDGEGLQPGCPEPTLFDNSESKVK